MRRAIPGCISASSSTVSVPCFVAARTRAPGIGGSSIAPANGALRQGSFGSPRFAFTTVYSTIASVMVVARRVRTTPIQIRSRRKIASMPAPVCKRQLRRRRRRKPSAMLALCNPLPVADSGLLTNGDDRARSEIGNRVSVLPLHAETASGTVFPPVGLPQLGNNVEKDALGSEQFVTAPSRPRRVLRRGAIVVAAGAGAWLIGSLLMIFGSGIQVVQSTGGGTAATGGSFTLGGAYVLPFTVFG